MICSDVKAKDGEFLEKWTWRSRHFKDRFSDLRQEILDSVLGAPHSTATSGVPPGPSSTTKRQVSPRHTVPTPSGLLSSNRDWIVSPGQDSPEAAFPPAISCSYLTRLHSPPCFCCC